MKTTLYLLASYFETTQFDDNKNCPVSLAAQERFNTTSTFEIVNKIIINNSLLLHKPYTYRMFKKDLAMAKLLGFAKVEIRKIELAEGPVLNTPSVKTMIYYIASKNKYNLNVKEI